MNASIKASIFFTLGILSVFATALFGGYLGGFSGGHQGVGIGIIVGTILGIPVMWYLLEKGDV